MAYISNHLVTGIKHNITFNFVTSNISIRHTAHPGHSRVVSVLSDLFFEPELLGGISVFFRASIKQVQIYGVIHSDFERGFIRAEVIGYDDYVTLGGEKAARDNGKLRLEGKEYIVKDY